MEYIGTEGDDELVAQTGEDNSFQGLGGDDTLTGNSGTDTAVFAGASDGYRLGYAAGSFTVTDVDPADGDSGTDTLAGIERLQFTDGTLSISEQGEFRVNTTTWSTQSDSDVAALSDGGYVVTWMSNGQDGSGCGICVQRFGADGTPRGAESVVNTTTEAAQLFASVTALSGGGFVVSWLSHDQDGSGTGIYARRYAADGSAQGGEFRVNSATADDQRDPDVTALAGGGFVVTWMSLNQDGSNAGVYAQRYAAGGMPQGGEFRVNTTTASDQAAPSIAALADGGFVASWMSWGQDGSGRSIHAQRYGADGAALGGEFRVNTATAGEQMVPSIAALQDGGFVVCWVSNGQDGSGDGVYGQRYAADGTAVGGEFRVNTTTAFTQNEPDVAALSGGGFVVALTSDGQDGSGRGTYAQRYAADGTPQGGEFRLNPTTANDQAEPAIAGLADGGFVVSWTSTNQDGGGDGIYAQRYTADGTPVIAVPVVEGDGGANTLFVASPGFARLRGGAGDDTYILHGGLHDLVEVAGGGTDTVRSSADHTLRSHFENLVLAGNADLDGTGNTLANWLIGNRGANALDGSTGADTLQGLGGNDSYRVDQAGDVVRESRQVAGGVDEVIATISYVLGAGLENLRLTGSGPTDGAGNGLANVLLGSAGANLLSGDRGDDTLDGGAGADQLTGGSGADLFRFSTVASVDAITDFRRSAGDRIDLSMLDADRLTGDRQGFAFLGRQAFSADATGQLRYEAGDGKLMLYGSVDADVDAEFVLEVVGTVRLFAADLVL